MGMSGYGHSGVCDHCGCFDHLMVGDLGQLCDDCCTVARVRADYATHPTLAAQIYCAATAEDALRLMGVRP